MCLEASVIIPTYNGAHKISALLQALNKENNGRFEIIVVVDGSTDNTIEKLEEWRHHFVNFKTVSQANRGRSVARNVGARHANAELLIFFDDDMIPNDRSLSRHCAFHRRVHGLLCGHQSEYFGNEESDVQNYKAWLTAKWTDRYRNGLTRMSRSSISFAAANCSIPKKLFCELGGFTEDLRDGEDYELGCRALLRHIPIYYDKSNVALHTERITCRSYILRQREYAEAHRKITDLDDSTETRWRHQKRAIYRLFAFSVWVNLIDKGFFVKWIARPFRFRLYAIVIHALSKEYPKVKL